MPTHLFMENKIEWKKWMPPVVAFANQWGVLSILVVIAIELACLLHKGPTTEYVGISEGEMRDALDSAFDRTLKVTLEGVAGEELMLDSSVLRSAPTLGIKDRYGKYPSASPFNWGYFSPVNMTIIPSR
jgi:hypothetical protein